MQLHVYAHTPPEHANAKMAGLTVELRQDGPRHGAARALEPVKLHPLATLHVVPQLYGHGPLVMGLPMLLFGTRGLVNKHAGGATHMLGVQHTC